MNVYFAIGIAAAIGFLIAFGLGYVIIPWLHKLNFGQTILDIGPKWHKDNEGTPNMGGLLFIIGTLVSFGIVFIADKLLKGQLTQTTALDVSMQNVKLWGGIVMALGFAVIGFADDYIGSVKKQNAGLNERQKSILQLLVILGYLGSLYAVGADYMFIPFYGNVNMGIFFWFLGVFAIYSTVNAVNITDGVDGLCASVTVTAAAAFTVVALLRNCMGFSLLSAALAGACGGYLIWNWHPCKVMMGDTGSLFLGGMIVACAYAADCPLLILPMGFIYVTEIGSVLLQRVYYKLTHGKRIFKMTPIHHSYEMSGWKETKIVKTFAFVNLLTCAAGILIVYFGNPK